MSRISTSSNGRLSSSNESDNCPSSPTTIDGAAAAIRVTHSETQENNKRYTVYKVFVNCGCKTWFIFRRYNEFSILYDLLKQEFPSAPFRLPGKKIFGNLNPNFVEKRRAGLDQFVQQILSDQEVLQHPVVREFFLLDEIDKRPSPSPVRQMRNGARSPRTSTNVDTESEDDILNTNQNPFDLGQSERINAKPSDFEFQKVIGKGSFGKVFLARHKSESKYYAVKVLQKEQIKRRNEVKHIMSERNVLVENINHPFLLFFHLQKEKAFDEARARFYSAEIASALGYLHKKDIIYRDLKPENLLLDSEGHVVITDFGLCKEGIKGQETTATFCGTPEYLAPEVIQKQPYGKTVDWWCLGCVLYEMLFGLPPFYSRDHRTMYENILYKPLRIRTSVSPAAREILVGLLNKNPQLRLGSKEDFEEIKSNVFFISIDWNDLDARKVKPPFNPGVKNSTDTKNIDKEFLSLSIPNSVANPTTITTVTVKGVDDDFHGFSYAPPINDDDVF